MNMVYCHACGHKVHEKAPTCPECGALQVLDAPIDATSVTQSNDHGTALVAIPCVGIALIWGWVAQMALIQRPDTTLFFVGLATALPTAALAFREMKANSGKRGEGLGPAGWFALIFLIWPFFYPAYLRRRALSGLPNKFLVGLLIAIVFSFSYGFIQYAISSKRAEVIGKLDETSRYLKELKKSLDKKY